MKLTSQDISLLKAKFDKAVEIETTDGQRLVAKTLRVFHSEEPEKHEISYELLSSNMLDRFRHRETAGGYAIDLNEISTVKPTTYVPSKVPPTCTEHQP